VILIDNDIGVIGNLFGFDLYIVPDWAIENEKKSIQLEELCNSSKGIRKISISQEPFLIPF
jgi:hypothetical protein